MARAARHLTLEASPGPAEAYLVGPARGASVLGAMVAVLAFLPVWLPGPLMLGDFSLAFLVPFALALWSLSQPARPGAIGRALGGGFGRGLWLEAMCIAAIAILAGLTMLYSPEPLRAFRVILPMSYALCTLILLARAPPARQLRLVLAALYAGALVLGFALLLTQSGAGRSLVMRDYRFLGFFENPNQLGVVFLAVWPLSLALLMAARTARVRLVHVAIVMVLAGSILMSGTKTALALGFVSGALTWLYHGSRTGSIGTMLARLAMILCAIVLAVPAILWLLSWASPLFFERVDAILKNGVWAFRSMQTRDEIWKESLQIGLAHPLLGEGAGTGVYGYSHSHNMLLDYFRGMGVFALSAAVLLVLSAVARASAFLRSTWRKGQYDRRSDTIVASMYIGAVFYLVGNMLSDSFSPTTSFLFWVMYLGAYMATVPIARTQASYANRAPIGWQPRPKRATSPAIVAQPV